MSGARIAIVSAPADAAWRDAAAAALAGYEPRLTPLEAGSEIDPALCVVLVWTGEAAGRAPLARRLLGARADIVLWRPDDAPTPDWLAHACPVGPEMEPHALRLVVQFALDEAARRDLTPPVRRTWGRKAMVMSGVAAGVILAAAGLSLFAAGSDAPDDVAHAPPVSGLRGWQ